MGSSSGRDNDEHSLTATRLADALASSEADGRTVYDALDSRSSGTYSAGDLLAERFRIVRWIATGGMGEVYEAEDLELGERVALKRIRREIASQDLAVARFRREISVARKVTHPGICRVFDVFYHAPGTAPAGAGSRSASDRSASDRSASHRPSMRSTKPKSSPAAAKPALFLTMELLTGPTLSAHLRDAEPMTTDEAWPLVRQMAAALAAAHAVGVVHRDFKSSNVILANSPSGIRAVITDFGLAHEMALDEGATEVTATGEIVGSPDYMAPEQAKSEATSPATDVYALGVVMFKMVTGRLPFEANSPITALLKRLKDAPPSPRTYVKDLDPQWESVILRCLARAPTDRFADANEVLTALEAKPPQPRRRWLEALLALFVIAALVAHLDLVMRSKPETSTETVDDSTTPTVEPLTTRPSIAVLGFKNLSGRPDTAWLSTALAELLITELNAGDRLRTVPGENVAHMRIELSVMETDSLAADTLASIGQYLNSDFVVLGSYFTAGTGSNDLLRLDLRIQDTAAGVTIATLSQTATEAQLLDLVASLGSELRRLLGADGPADPSTTPAGASLPANPTAARLYAEGVATLHSFDPLAARDLLTQSITADPDYPLAYAALAEAWSALGYDRHAMEQISKALELSSGLSRQERLLIEGRYHEFEEDWDRAIEIYRSLYEFFPDNLEYGLDLVRAQTGAAMAEDAQQTLEMLRRLPAPAGEDPRIDLREVIIAASLAQYQRQLEAAIRAEEKGRRLGARRLVARARLDQGRAMRRLGRLDEASAAALDAHRVLLELGDLSGAANALNVHGVVLYNLGDLEAASAAYDEALAMVQDIGDRSSREMILNNQAIVLYVQGDLDGASRLYEETLRIGREVDNRRSLTFSLYNLALVRTRQGETAAAKAMLLEALAIARDIETPYLVATRLMGLASLIQMEGDLAGARRHFLEAHDIFLELDDRNGLAAVETALGDIDQLEDDLVSARRRFEEALAIRRELQAEGRIAESRFALAMLAFDMGDAETAIAEARQTTEAFGGLERPREQGLAKALEARSLVTLGQLTAAREAIDRASEFAGSVADISFDAFLAIVDAEVLAAEGKSEEALASLQEQLATTEASDRIDVLFRLHLALGRLELAAGLDAGQQRLVELERDASEQGFALFARLAREAR